MVLTVLDGDDVVMMLLRYNLAVLHWLHRSMVVVLVDLAVNCSGGLLVAGFGEGLIDNGGGDLFMDGGVMVTSLGPREERCQFLCLYRLCQTGSWTMGSEGTAQQSRARDRLVFDVFKKKPERK